MNTDDRTRMDVVLVDFVYRDAVRTADQLGVTFDEFVDQAVYEFLQQQDGASTAHLRARTIGTALRQILWSQARIVDLLDELSEIAEETMLATETTTPMRLDVRRECGWPRTEID